MKPTETHQLRTTDNWKPWLAWHPVRLLDGSWTWLRIVYRTEVCTPPGVFYYVYKEA